MMSLTSKWVRRSKGDLRPGWFGFPRLVPVLLLAAVGMQEIKAFRLVDENGSTIPFVPYEQGFVGRYGDPFTTFTSDRVNEGAPGTPTYPRLYEGVYPRQICPGMVGPVEDGMYYCLGKEHGYCDRRSGTCFCNVGYQGISCEHCSSTHYSEGGLCYPKLLCPSDCSGAGTCHHSNGTCTCLPHRVGDDCASPYCSSMFSSQCAECTFDGCTSCESGYYVDHAGGGVDCLPCYRYDPRCTRCNEQSCTECTDPLLLSIRRSGARIGDPPLPFDEMERELPHTLEFGTQDPRYFTSAEAFDVVANASSPLNETSLSCAQGVFGDDSWSCENKPISHRVCGNPGTISFSSPEYEAFEDPSASAGAPVYGMVGTTNGTVRVTVTRTGGGYGAVGVRYWLRHGTTDEGDVTPHAFYTTSDEIVFDPGVVEISILLGVHEDGKAETNEKFDLLLFEPWGGARLGSQQRTTVTIVDAEGNGTLTHHSKTSVFYSQDFGDEYGDALEGGDDEAADDSSLVDGDGGSVAAIAGVVNNATIVARDALGVLTGFGGDVFDAWVGVSTEAGRLTGDNADPLYNASPFPKEEIGMRVPAAAADAVVRVEDLGSGNHTLSYQVNAAGSYLLHVALCRPGGLTGRYTSDSFSQVEEFRRVDRVMNFTWGAGPIAGTATDFAGITWSGRVRPDFSETFEFEVGTAEGGGDAARLWIDGAVVIDGFERGGSTVGDWVGAEEGLGGGGRGYVNLTAGTLHDIFVEYSERRGHASLYLAWSSSSVPYEIIPPTNLYWARELGSDGGGSGSPVALSVRSALTVGEESQAFGAGTVAAVAALPSTLTVVPRDAFGNLRADETDSDVASSDRFAVVLTAIDYDYDYDYVDSGGDDVTLGGVYGSAGSGGTVVTGKLEFDTEEGTYVSEYVPFVAGTHLLNVTLQQWLFEPSETHVEGSPFTVIVSPGEAFGRRSEASGNALLSNGSVAGAVRSLRVRARDVVGNAIWEGGSEVAVYAFHRQGKAFTRGSVEDFGNGSYHVSLTPTVAGPYDISVAIDGQEVADSPYSVVVTPGNAYGPASSAYGAGVSAAVATIENTFYVQARDSWGNNLWGSAFNVTAALFLAHAGTEGGSVESNRTTIASNDTENANWYRSWDEGAEGEGSSVIAFFGNGSGLALVSYVPREAGISFLYVRVDGLQLPGSPFEVGVSAGPARGANSTASGSALSLATAGKNASFVIQARDHAANPADSESDEEQGEGEGLVAMSATAAATGVVFNVSLTRKGDAQEDGDGDGGDNSTAVVDAAVAYLGNGKYEAVYNATKAGNYSLTVVDASDGEHAVGSPFQVLVEPNQAFAPATLVWWDKQVAGSKIIHLQAVDFWGNNITQGGEAFVARWTARESPPHETAAADNIATDDDDDIPVREGDLWSSSRGWDDTASAAAGFFFPASSGDITTTTTTETNDSNTLHTSSGGYTGAHVTDVGGGRYEVTTATEAGSFWLEIGVVEPGGLWGTFYEDGGVETEVVSWTPEADWRTKSAVDFDWGVLSPGMGINAFGQSPSLVSGVNASGANGTSSTSDAGSSSSLLSLEYMSGSGNASASSIFPADYFSARFTGFVKAEIGGEYRFRVATDSSSKAALSISGVDLFNDILAPLESPPESTELGGSASGFTAGTESRDAPVPGGESSSGLSSASVSAPVGNIGTAAIAEGRTESVVLVPGELVPVQLRYAHTTGEAWIRLEWASRHTGTHTSDTGSSTTVVPATSLFHHRPGWKIAVDLHPAATAAGASTVAAWPSSSHDKAEEIGVVAQEEEEGGERQGAEGGDEGTGVGVAGNIGSGGDGDAGDATAARLLLASPKRVSAGKMMDIVVQARDMYGNLRGVGGDSVQMYGQGPGGVLLLGGSVVDSDDGNYTVSAWPVVAGAYHVSVTVSTLEPSRWALGYRNVEQAMAGAHVYGSPFRLMVMEGAAAANASLAYGVGIDAPLAGGLFGTSVFTIRARDAMGNRVSSGSTGDFTVETFQTDEDGDSSLISIGEAVYTAGGEYSGTYNVTVAGDYALHVTLTTSGGHVTGSPFSVHVSPGPALAATSVCDNCEAILPSSTASTAGKFSANVTKVLRLSARDAFGNALKTGGEAWFARLRGEEEAVSDPGVRHPVVVDEGDGSYTVAVKAGIAGLYNLQVMLLSSASTGDALADLSGTYGGGGLTARYYTNARLAGRPLVTRIDPSIRLDWGSGVPNGVAAVGSTGGTVGVRWEGFLKSQLSGAFIFTISTGAGDEARLWIRDELVIDTSSTSSSNLAQHPKPTVPRVITVASRNASFLTAGEAAGLRAEYIYHGSGGGGGSTRTRAVRIVVGWESPGGILQAQALPSYMLYPSGQDIVGSPFGFSVVA